MRLHTDSLTHSLFCWSLLAMQVSKLGRGPSSNTEDAGAAEGDACEQQQPCSEAGSNDEGEQEVHSGELQL